MLEVFLPRVQGCEVADLIPEANLNFYGMGATQFALRRSTNGSQMWPGRYSLH